MKGQKLNVQLNHQEIDCDVNWIELDEEGLQCQMFWSCGNTE
jgi:hypothetical protein